MDGLHRAYGSEGAEIAQKCGRIHAIAQHIGAKTQGDMPQGGGAGNSSLFFDLGFRRMYSIWQRGMGDALMTGEGEPQPFILVGIAIV